MTQIQATAEDFPPQGGKPTLALEPMGERYFQGLYEQYNRPLYYFFTNRGFCREESRDLVQETFVAAYGGRGSFRGDSPAADWLFGIAKNVWRTNLRDRKRLKRDAQVVSLDGPAHGNQSDRPRAALLADGAQENRPLEKCLADERTRLLYDALQELPERMRLCVVLHLRGYKYREIAGILKVSINTVRSQLFDARDKLRKRLAGHFSNLPPFPTHHGGSST